MVNDVMAMAGVQLGIPKRIIYVKNTNLDILNKRLTDEGKEETKNYNEAKVLLNPEMISKNEMISSPISQNCLEILKLQKHNDMLVKYLSPMDLIFNFFLPK